ncbi:hypothetical protein OBBRIDRAFT_839111 [Obba rivulosa]|uniref:F-box domain-containing protein n=1 Tax=Obba rivulosa TaxID=1052685 RepID=A0A8E2ATX3_9APHY|nr:hypothetical protein OBBRIDRAFT_839111 [Obba rivulosa]
MHMGTMDASSSLHAAQDQERSLSGYRAQMPLNHDVLCLIASSLPISDLLSMMRTCRDIHAFGVGRLLSSGIHLRNNAIAGFCRFVLRDAHTRLPALRKLSFSIDAYTYCAPDANSLTPSIDLLIQLLSQASQLHTLSISHFADLVQLGSQRMVSSFSGLFGLKVLCVHDVDVNGREVFHHMHQLTSVEVHFSTFDEVDPLPMFASSSATLEVLRVLRCSFRQLTTVQFSGVGVLQLDPSDYVEAAPLLEAFPNLHTLQTVAARIPSDYPSRLQAFHEGNHVFHTRRSWTQLRAVKGDIISLYALALVHPVRSLSIARSQRNNPRITPDIFSVVLSSLRPSHLAVDLDTSDFNFETYCTIPDVVQGVTHFSVRLVSSGYTGSTLLTLFKSVIVTHLVIEILIYGSRASLFLYDNTRPSLVGMSQESFVGLLATSITALQFIAIRRGDGTSMYWSVARRNGIATSETLSDADGRRIMETEDLTFWDPPLSRENEAEASRYWLA